MLTAVVSSLELCPKLVLPVVVESELILYLLIATFILFVDVSVCHLLLPSLHSSPFLCSPVPHPCPASCYLHVYVRSYVRVCVLNSEEQQRRVDVSSLKYYVKVLINGREVAKSAEK